MSRDLRSAARQIYEAAVRAVHPARAMARAFDDPPPVGRRIWVLALGKAAAAMTDQAVRFLAAQDLAPIGGLMVIPSGTPPPDVHPHIRLAIGDHPEPGTGSLGASASVQTLVTSVQLGDQVWVLLSGGTTSLVAAPVDGVSVEELQTLFRLVSRSGLDIRSSNRIRKRFSRWGAGRLAVALGNAGAHIHLFVISDVIGDDLAAIGSGPCVGDPSTADEIRQLLEAAGLWTQVPRAMRAHLERAGRDPALETPKPRHPAFERVRSRLIANNDDAKQAGAAHAVALGYRPDTLANPLVGEASVAGRRFVDSVLASRTPGGGASDSLIAGGETTVTLEDRSPTAGTSMPRGGRSQEFALAAAERLAALEGRPDSWVVLAAGTDGRDGPTDAAGAIVDGATWESIRRAGRDPGRDLAHHDSYPALEAAGELFKPGPTGTNVMDLVIALYGSRESGAGADV